jgi:hypothetical protein
LDSPVSNQFEDIAAAEARRQGMAVLAAISAMGESLTQAEASLAEGYRLDLAGLEVEMGRLCATAQKVTPEMAPSVRRGLEALLGRVDRLSKALPPPQAQESRP